jgi:hypothetical protein
MAGDLPDVAGERHPRRRGKRFAEPWSDNDPDPDPEFNDPNYVEYTQVGVNDDKNISQRLREGGGQVSEHIT